MPDRWADSGGGITGPIERAVAVTPAAADLADVARAVWVGGTGTQTATATLNTTTSAYAALLVTLAGPQSPAAGQRAAGFVGVEVAYVPGVAPPPSTAVRTATGNELRFPW